MRFAEPAEGGQATFSAAQGLKTYFTLRPRARKPSQSCTHRKRTTFVAPGEMRAHPCGGLELQLARYCSGAKVCPVFFRHLEMRSKIMSFGRYESSDGNNVGTAITFFLIGLGAGALTALALAPKTGKQFRRDLKRGYDDAKETLEDWTEEAKDRVRDAKERVRDVAERGADLAEDLREKVEPLRRVVSRG